MISILLSCYKSNIDYLKKQIDSIINQTIPSWELLVYLDNDEPTLNGRIRIFLDTYKDKRIKWFIDGHKGYAKAYNFLLQQAKGEYVCFCDHDDIWEDDKLEVEKAYLDSHPEVDCVFGWLRWFGEKEKVEAFKISDEDISKELYFYQPIKQPTAMFRKEKFWDFDSPFDSAGDFWFWAKFKDRHYHLIEWVMVNYRRHADELTKDKTAFRENSAKVIQASLLERFGVTPSLDVCKMLDPYSKTYNPELKKFIKSIV